METTSTLPTPPPPAFIIQALFGFAAPLHRADLPAQALRAFDFTPAVT